MSISFVDSALIKEIAPGVTRRILNLNNLMVAEIVFLNGPQTEPDPPHNHPHEQVSYVVEGDLFVFINGEKTKLKKGDMFSVPSDLPHSIQLLSTKVVLLDTFTPIRQEFL